jgi:hypothetical protein
MVTGVENITSSQIALAAIIFLPQLIKIIKTGDKDISVYKSLPGIFVLALIGVITYSFFLNLIVTLVSIIFPQSFESKIVEYLYFIYYAICSVYSDKLSVYELNNIARKHNVSKSETIIRKFFVASIALTSLTFLPVVVLVIYFGISVMFHN